MKRPVAILGAGFGGLELATRLSESVADEISVTLLDQNEAFAFGFSKLDVPSGRKPPADLLLHCHDITNEMIDSGKSACRRSIRRRAG